MQELTKSAEFAQSPDPAESTADDYIVDYSSAEQLARCFEAFTPVQIRETLEFEPFTEAMRLLNDFSRKAQPYRELQHHAMVNELGYYKSRQKRPSAQQEYQRYLAYLELKDSVHWAKNGTRLTASGREDLTRAFYAPAYRAEMAKLSAESWAAHRGSEREHGGRRDLAPAKALVRPGGS